VARIDDGETRRDEDEPVRVGLRVLRPHGYWEEDEEPVELISYGKSFERF
jgi:hypothetical protein